MNKTVFGFICVFLAVASAQTECIQALEVSLPALQKMYLDVTAKNWVAFETEIEQFIPHAKIILASCAGYNVTDTPRVQACITDTENIARLIVPVIMNPEDMTALYTLMFQLPGYLSTFYGQCINPTQIKTDHDYVSVLLEQKVREGDIYDCLSSVYALLPSLQHLAADISKQSDMQIIANDLELIAAQFNTVCGTCGIPRTLKSAKPADVEKCVARVANLYTVVEAVLHAGYDIQKIIQGIRVLAALLPDTLADCGIQI